MEQLKVKIKNFFKWIIDECRDRKTIVIFLIVMLVVYFPTWGGFLFYYIFKWKWCFAIATGYFAFWMGPFTPFFPLCIAIALGIKRKIDIKNMKSIYKGEKQMKIKRTNKRILKLLMIAVCIIVVSLIGGKSYATTNIIDTAKTTESVKLRKKATTKSKVKVTIKKGKKVDILKKNVAESNGYTWYKVKYGNKTGYVASRYLKSTKKTTSAKTTSNKINSKQPMVALTFDDGPNGTVTPKILDVLEKYGVVATFFDLGTCMKSYPKVSQRAEKIGCEVESHTYAHSNLSTLSVSQLQSDMSKAEKVYKQTLGHSPKLVRPPYGSINSRVKSTIKYPLINWDIDTLDWKSRNKNSIMKEIRKFKDYDGRVILMHGIYTSTLDAVKILIPELQKKGYQFVTVSEMAEYKGVKLKAGKIYCNFR